MEADLSNFSEDDSESFSERIGLLLEEGMSSLSRFHFGFSDGEIHSGGQHDGVLLSLSHAIELTEKVGQVELKTNKGASKFQRFVTRLNISRSCSHPHRCRYSTHLTSAQLENERNQSGGKRCNRRQNSENPRVMVQVARRGGDGVRSEITM